MQETNKPAPDRADDAAARVSEISGLFQSIRRTLERIRDDLEASEEASSRTVISKLNEIQSTHVKLLAAEEAFYAQQDAIDGIEAIDIDAIRIGIRGQLDRIRATLCAGEIPDIPE